MIFFAFALAFAVSSCKETYYQYTVKVVFIDNSVDTIVLPHTKLPANQVGISSDGCLFTVRNNRAVACGVKYFTIIKTTSL